uniref:Secreted protein n=2 Tax=Caenorhabditis japonica TaxID=281687 RepID=A0A8R1IQC8_CAEJA
MFCELVFITTMFVAAMVQCAKKTSETSKMKSHSSERPNPGSNSGGAGAKDAVPKPAADREAEKTPREADDNETINDAKSDWGAVQ